MGASASRATIIDIRGLAAIVRVKAPRTPRLPSQMGWSYPHAIPIRENAYYITRSVRGPAPQQRALPPTGMRVDG
eukprot:596534-Prymnesium_polylepis.1